MNHCLKYFKLVVYGNFNFNFSPIRRVKHSCMLLTAKGNVMISDWTACKPTTQVVVRTCRKFEKH
jgi:hypothetical protein